MAQVILPFIFGVLPSIIWLLFYLREDTHPEPKKMVIKVFFGGIIVALPAAVLEILVLNLISKLNIAPIFFSVLSNFLIIASIEELMKYFVVQILALSNPELDEPLDIMIYMIISALGFAAAENIFLFFSLKTEATLVFSRMLEISISRFFSAIILHALTSATIGFFLALSFCETKKRNKFLSSGFLISIFLHGLYNFSIIEVGGSLKFLTPTLIIIFLAIFVSFSFKRLKTIKSICKL